MDPEPVIFDEFLYAPDLLSYINSPGGRPPIGKRYVTT